MRFVPADWLKDYLEKSKADFVWLENLFVCEYGFASWLEPENSDEIRIVDCYGDGRFWEEFFIRLAKRKGKSKITFWTRRNPKAFERRFGCKVLRKSETGAYLMVREVD